MVIGLKNLFVPVLWILLLQFSSCKITDPAYNPKPDSSILTVSVEEVSCTEAWVRIRTKEIPFPCAIELYNNDKRVNTFQISSPDTTIYVSSLTANSTNIFQAYLKFGVTEIYSEKRTAKTLDMTRGFTLKTYRMGLHTGMLDGVAIINENDIWVVGEIYINDSTGHPEEQFYNAVHWDGIKWNLVKIFVEYRGRPSLSALNSIFILPDNKIILSNGGPYLPNENGWKLYHLNELGILGEGDGYIASIWGTSMNNLFFASTKGKIVHYNGTTFQKINTGTTAILLDIFGDFNRAENKYEILAIGSDNKNVGLKKLIRINPDNTCTILSDNGLPWSLSAIWFKTQRRYCICGDGYFTSNNIASMWERDVTKPPYYKTSIRGNGLNDIIVAGSFGLLMHFNGVSWTNYQGQTYIDGAYSGVDFKGNIFAVIGGDGEGPIVTIGKRN